jgi:hypothetical protein
VGLSIGPEGVEMVRGSLVAAATVAVWVVVAAAPVAAAPPTVTATPSTSLVDGQTVSVEGDGFAANSHYEIFECAGDSVDERRCDPRNAFEVDSDTAGHVVFDFRVDARLYLGPAGTTSYDCRTEAAGCRVGVGVMLEHENSAFATLEFQPGAPLLPVVSATAVPSTGLTDGQVVAVRGEHLSDLEAAWALECRTGGAPRACDHGRAVQLKPNADGTIATPLTVHAAFRSPLGDDVDCRTAGACSVVVSWGLAFVPDRFAQVPLTFGAPAPPTTSPTSEPPVTVAELPRTGTPAGTSRLAALGLMLVVAGAVAALRSRPAG